MTQWLSELDIREEWYKTRDQQMNLSQLCEALVSKISNLPQYQDDFTLDEIARAFKKLQVDQEPNIAEFDNIMNRLYDWADTTIGYHPFPNQKRKCWIKVW